MNSKFSLAIAGICVFLAWNAHAATLMTNQAAWQESSSDNGANPLTTINLTTATYVNAYVPGHEGSDALTLSLNAPFEVTFDDSNNLNGFDPYPSISGGSVSSPLANRNTFFVTFGVPVYSFGALFNVPTSDDPLNPEAVPGIDGGGTNGVIGLIAPGFNGFVSNTPFTSLMFFSATCSPAPTPNCSGNLSMSDIQVSTSPTSTPEPSSFSLITGSVIVLSGIFRRKLVRI